MSKLATRTAALLVSFACASVAPAQWTTNFPDALTTGGGNTIPFNWTSTPQFTLFMQYPGTPASPAGGGTTSLQAQGVPAGARLTHLACVPSTAGSGTYVSNNALILIGHVVGTASSTQWSANLVNPVVLWDSTVDGPLMVPWTSLTWTSYIANPSAVFNWDGVNDIGINISLEPAGAVTNRFSVVSSPASVFFRHGTSAVYNAPPGTPTTTTGTLAMRQRMIFDPGLTMSATTSGGGVGDLVLLPLVDFPVGANEGFTLITANTTGPLGSGPAFGITPDLMTFDILQQPAFPGNPLHFVTGFPTLYPEGSLIVAPGTLSFLAGQSWRMVTVAFGPGLTYLQRSNVVQVDW